jgi:hyperosmotically inducible periplasmic protein
MNKNRVWLFVLLVSLTGEGALAVAQQPSDQDSSTQSTSASAGNTSDNTKVNQRDRNTGEPTADKQSNNRSDRATTQQIRRALSSDKALSTYAHNVKIITQNGQVTLKGPVRSDDEKRAIEAKAAEIAGENKVTSELAVKPKS